ncbi:possible lipoprotein [Alloactinosynnema sp. L-07]|nr:possible lipoprotein [Alloactinosynnema sp. L-07]
MSIGACVGATIMLVITGAAEPVAEIGSRPALVATDLPATTTTRAPVDLGGQTGGATVGALVIDRTTGRTVLADGADGSFHSQSLVKLLIAVDALERGTGTPSQITKMLSASDDGVASALWSQGGGGAIVTRWTRRLGLTGTAPPSEPGRWGQTKITATDVARIYRYLTDEAPPAHRDIVLTALRAAPRVAADGFDQHFGIPSAAAGLGWAVKQGWACCLPTRDLHTTGLVGPDDRYVVVLLTAHPRGVPWNTAAATATRLAENVLAPIRG